MSKSFWKIVNRVIEDSDILLEVLDSRMVEKTRNEEIEDKIKFSGKPIIYVINKCDLADKEEVEKYKRKMKPCVFISATKRLGTTILLQEIIKQSNLLRKEGRVVIGVLGYPNTGKSSVINILAGRHSVRTSPISGYTKRPQLVKMRNNLYLMDTPGVFAYKERDEKKHSIIAAKDESKIKDPDLTVMNLIREFPGVVENFYGVKENIDPEKTLTQISVKYNRLKKGGEPDIQVMARKILQDWQAGRIGKEKNSS